MRRATSLAVATVALATSFPAMASRAEPLPVYTISGRKTVLTGTATKLIRVRFEKPLAAEDLHFDVSGDGRVYGFLMRKVGYYGDPEGPRQEGLRPQVWGTTVGQCQRRGCRAHRGVVFVSNYHVKRFEGTWDFYLIADGAEVNVALTVHGVGGSATIDVDGAKGRPVKHEIRTLTPRLSRDAGETIYSAGDFSTMDQLDFGMLGLWAVGDSHVATAYGPCVYYGRTQPVTEGAFTPGCPGAKVGPTFSGASISDPPAEGTSGIIYTVRSSGPPDAPRGVGGWFATASEMKRHGAVALWIDYPGVDTEYR